MKKISVLVSIMLIINLAYSQKKAFFESDSITSTALIKTKGGSNLKKLPVLVKLNGKYNYYYGNGGTYNVNGSLKVNTLIPSGNTRLEVIYEGMPPIELSFNAEKDCEYNILADDDNKQCVKVYKKNGKDYIPVSDCGSEILYKETACNNCATVTTKLTVFKLDGLYGNYYGMFPAYVFPENYEFKIEAGKHIFEVMSSYSWKPATFEFVLEAGKTYKIDAESKKGEWNAILKEE